jgi:hypothetical protein
MLPEPGVIDPVLVMKLWSSLSVALVGVASGCVPSGSAGPQDAGTSSSKPTTTPTTPQAPIVPQAEVMKVPFEDDFDHPAPPLAAGIPSGVPTLASDSSTDTGSTSALASASQEPDPDWITTGPGIWHIEAGRLCGEHAKNHGIWLKRVLPVNARIEFDALSQSADGDLKAEYWGDGRSYATTLSYTNATSYLTILGGWHNKFHVLARINEHGNDRKEITVDPNSDDPREKPVVTGQRYHFKVERVDGKTVKWWVDGNEMLSYVDPAPLAGAGHDHFGFNDWDVKVCFDNVRVVPLP